MIRVVHIVVIAFSVLISSLLSNSLFAIDVFEFESDEQRELYQELGETLRCPKCQNQNIGDSDAPIAADMRSTVHRLIQEGKGSDEIRSFMIARFGDFVVYEPPLNLKTVILWFGPWLLLAMGFFVVLKIVRRNPEQSNPEITELSDAQKKRLAMLLNAEAEKPKNGETE